MIEAYTAADVREAERPLLAAERGFAGGLMHRAAHALARVVRRELQLDRGRVRGATVVGLVGSGNNGGDTLHALAVLARHDVRAVAVLTAPRVHDGGLAALHAAGGLVLRLGDDDGPGSLVRMGEVLAEAFAADVVLDGLLGIGARGGLRGPAAELVRSLTELLAEARSALVAPPPPTAAARGPLVVAVDVPSGIGVDDGELPGPVLPADLTVTFGAAKPGLLLPPAAAAAGVVEIVDLGLRPGLTSAGRRPVVTRLGADETRAEWPIPSATAHKYTRGVVGVVAGSPAYPGAAVLTVGAALAAGCGMVRHVGPDVVRGAVLAAHPEVVAGSGRVQAWVLGPGVAGEGSQGQLASLRYAARQALHEGLPVVADAGALGVLPDRPGPLWVLTPHAGELAELLRGRGVPVDREQVEASPLRWAGRAHDLTGATVLLKGPTIVVVGPEGAYAQAEAPAWLATAGAGDVLAGVLGAVLAGRAQDLPGDGGLVARLAAVAASVHGRAAHRANPGGPVTASAVSDALPAVIADLVTPPGSSTGHGPRLRARREPRS